MGDIGQLFGAGLTAVSEADIAAQNINLQRETNRQNYYMFREGQDFTASEAQKARLFNSSEAQKSRDFQAQQLQAQQSFNESMYQNYMSPQAQSDSLKSASINPVGAVHGAVGSVQSATLGSGAQASTSPVSSPGAPVLQAPRIDRNPVAAFIDSFNAQQLAQANARKAKADANLSEIDGETRYLENYHRVQKLHNEATQVLAQTGLTRAERERAEKEVKRLDNELKLFDATYDFMVGEKKASMESSIAGVRQAVAQAILTEQDAIFADALTQSKLQVADATVKHLKALAQSALLDSITNKFNAYTRKRELDFDIGKYNNTGASLERYLTDYYRSSGKLNDENQKYVKKQIKAFTHQIIQGYIGAVSGMVRSIGGLVK